ncbi:hypothetical protein [uncultured Roseibium sp.]|uniref:hypothetical protein n=1 Tax=uncultured Roseibium sp. TaxID=1936171 RepID=UPI0032180B0E
MFYTGPITVSHAETLEWQFRSEHPKVVDVELYSHSRRGHVWPGNNKVYVLNDYSTKTIRISCRSGEKVCYGAWVRNRQRSYWGVGYNNRNSCRSCCYTCNGGQTKIIVLNP